MNTYEYKAFSEQSPFVDNEPREPLTGEISPAYNDPPKTFNRLGAIFELELLVGSLDSRENEWRRF